MPEQPVEDTIKLHIWQQNLNTFPMAQASLLNNPDMADWDVIAIQEPYINFLCNTSVNNHWHVIYLSWHYTHPQHKTCTSP
jgi:hypothetical protein